MRAAVPRYNDMTKAAAAKGKQHGKVCCRINGQPPAAWATGRSDRAASAQLSGAGRRKRFVDLAPTD
jgi:hypothetical protein